MEGGLAPYAALTPAAQERVGGRLPTQELWVGKKEGWFNLLFFK